MAWSVEFTLTAEKQLKKLDKKWQSLILDYLEDDIATLDDPRSRGKALVGDKKGFWRYRIGDYRALCKIEDDHMIIIAVVLGHRENIYGD
ncbi:MAG: type II toxin-antitoxin system RelE/ParE family toxin [Clostridia bacterium]